MFAVRIGVAYDPDGGAGHLLNEGIPLHYLADVLTVDFARTAGGCIMGIDDYDADWRFPVSGQVLDFLCELGRVLLAGVEPGRAEEPGERDSRCIGEAVEFLVSAKALSHASGRLIIAVHYARLLDLSPAIFD